MYGEPLPESLKLPRNILDIARQHELTSVLCWGSTSDAKSSLHYDMTEGLMVQMQGTKTFELVSFENVDLLHPFPRGHDLERQCKLGLEIPPEIIRVMTISPGDALYIPFGWFHRVTSRGPFLSVSLRWNPWENQIKSALMTYKLLPSHVEDVLAGSCPEPIARVISHYVQSHLPA